ATSFADMSFISLKHVLPSMVETLRYSDVWACVLVKQQFEAGRAEVGKGGVVRDAAVHARVVSEIADEFRKLGLAVQGSIESPVKGPAGNREYLLAAVRA